MPEPDCRLASLPSLNAISVTGADAAEFLAAQLSQAPPSADAVRAPLSAWHDAKGRVQALFRIISRDEGYLLVTHASVVDDVADALRRYVLRAEVTIEVDTDVACVALVGDSTSWLAEHGVRLGTERWAVTTEDNVAWLRLGPALVHAVSTTDRIEQLSGSLPDTSTEQAELAEIELGIPAVSAELRGQFLPQMLNLDVLGGVAFDKGCYPGQEIIARAQNLGSVKRRLFRFTRAQDGTIPAVGSTLQDAKKTDVGTIVRAARSESGIEILAVIRLEAAKASLTTEDTPDQPLSLASVPYEIPDVDT